MGRPFNKEIATIKNTLTWAFSEPIDPALERLFSNLTAFHLLVVGSGGSLSAAHFVERLHQEVTGRIAKAITPLELIFSQINPATHAILLLSAGGKNRDILQALEFAIRREFCAIAVLCASVDSKIAKMANKYPYVQLFEYKNPAGKDGFLAVNSLLSTCVLAGRVYMGDTSNSSVQKLIESPKRLDVSELEKILTRKTIVALGGEWAWPALVDIESKFAEAALGNVVISDIRNFGHGRHHWFDKKGKESALLFLETPMLTKLVEKTIAIMPNEFPQSVLRSPFSGFLGGIDLLNQVFHLVKEAGMRSTIDPGRPRVPAFGRKVYHIGIPSILSGKRVKNRGVWIERKARVLHQPINVVEKRLDQFLRNLKNTPFAGIVFDYDGTLCDPPERFEQPKDAIAKAINTLLYEGIPVGIASGRGGSVQESLRRVIDKKYWDRILIGNYNGMVISPLINNLPKFDHVFSETMLTANEMLVSDSFIFETSKIEMRFNQISVSPNMNSIKNMLLERILELLSEFPGIKIVQSDHSFDIIDQNISKKAIVRNLRMKFLDQDANILVVGDQGQHGGNDFELLMLPFGLSVDKVSSLPNTCWNLSPVGIRGAEGTLSILKAIRITTTEFKLDTHLLEKVK